MKMLALAALLLPFSGPALAQGLPSGNGLPGSAQSVVPVPGSGVSNPGQLDFGTAGASGAAAGPVTVPGQTGTTGSADGFDRSRSGAGSASGPSGGAGISTGATVGPNTDEDYTQPIYGRQGR